MRVVIDGRMLGWTGIGRYTGHLVDELANLMPDDELVVLCRSVDKALWFRPGTNVRSHVVDLRPYSLAEQRHLGPIVRSLKADLTHFTHFNAPVRGGGDYVVTIHDLTMRRFRNLAGNGSVERLRYEAKHQALGLALRAIARRARAVLVPTQHVAGEVVSSLGVARQRVVVTPYAPDELTAAPVPVKLVDNGQPFLLHVGNFYPHKNLEFLLGALERMAGSAPLPLVLAGPPDWFEGRLREQARAGSRSGAVVFVGRVSDGELAWLYDHATAFVLPSLSEGFGLPGLEAMSRGLPVAAARGSCLPEVYGDAAVYFDPRDPRSLVDCLGKLLGDSSRRAALSNAGRQRAASFSWRRMGRQTLECYRRVLASGDSDRSRSSA